MKLSTFGIGSVLLCIIVGSATWVFFEGETHHFFTPGESQIALAAEMPRSANEPDYLIRGQLPLGKLTRREVPAANPLRTEEEEPRNRNELPPKPLVAQPLPAPPTKIQPTPLPVSQPIAQTAMQSDSNSGFSAPSSGLPSVNTSGFGEIPQSLSSQQTLSQQNVSESAGSGFGNASPFTQPAPPAPLEPQRLPNTSATEQDFQYQIAETLQEPRELPNVPLAGNANPLSNADPFAAENPSVAVPPINDTSSAPITSPQTLTLSNPSVNQSNNFSTNQDFNRSTSSPARTTLTRSSQDQNRTLQDRTLQDRTPQNRQEESEGTGIPGASILEGSQTPHVTLEKTFPPEIKINEPATVKIVLRNVGRSTAKNIIVKDRVPQGTRLLSTTPEATRAETGELFWSLGNLDANEQMILEMRILPFREGEIGSVAVINYSAEASARISVTRPMLKVDVKTPPEIQLGQIANIEITISNPGSATATGIVLEEYVPDGLYHKDGKVLVNKNVDILKPKEAKKLTLPLTCTGPGNLVNRLIVKGNGNLMVEEKTTIRALAPILKLGIDGANQQFLERKSVYRLIVANQGTAPAQNVDLIATLPVSVKFVSTNQSGVYEPQTHSVHWALEELPAQEAGEIELVLLPSQTGDHSIRFKGVGQHNLKAEETKSIVIDGLPAISFEVVGESNLVEVGKETVYEIRVTNKGTKAAGNVKVRANLSEGITYARADGPVRHQTSGNIIAFDSLTQLEAKGEKVYKIAAKCLSDGDHRITVQVVSDDLSSPITKEESTRVYR
ncbi:MAG: DUF11 domain-containing protein [Planctomycetaceae bacterium]|jgi:uncharacterized repeat protein (TIGR01451 family)|nr:DUF11 domain-containing protein [Planctomycetaceae bacterium]